MGWFEGGAARSAQLNAVVMRANDALVHGRWDAPAGDNVRELTDEGLAHWPKNPQLLGIRALAGDGVLHAARAESENGDGTEALRLARVALDLDPDNGDARRLVADWSREPAPSPGAADSAVPPLATGAAPLGAPPSGGLAATAPSTSVRAALEASDARPGVGQPVDFVARISGGTRPKLDGPRFRIAGPGIAAGTELPAADDGSGSPRTTFTFLQAGRFDVSFSAHIGTSIVHASRPIVVGATAPPRATPAPAPPPAASGAKWL